MLIHALRKRWLMIALFAAIAGGMAWSLHGNMISDSDRPLPMVAVAGVEQDPFLIPDPNGVAAGALSKIKELIPSREVDRAPFPEQIAEAPNANPGPTPKPDTQAETSPVEGSRPPQLPKGEATPPVSRPPVRGDSPVAAPKPPLRTFDEEPSPKIPVKAEAPAAAPSATTVNEDSGFAPRSRMVPSAKAKAPEATLEARRQKIRADIEATFEARQRAQVAEVQELRRRLKAVEERLDIRSRLKQRIIDRRVEELMTPGVRWDDGTDPPGRSPATVGEVEGVVLEIQPAETKAGQDQVVLISIGGNDGIRPGQLLVVYRLSLDDPSKYPPIVVGKIRIVATREASADGLVLNDSPGRVLRMKKGDRVANEYPLNWKERWQKITAPVPHTVSEAPKVEGHIVEVQAPKRKGGNDLVRVSVGSDDGMRIGHMLVTFRRTENDKISSPPKYLGSIRIIEVHAKDSVAEVLKGTQAGVIQKGDHVTNAIPSLGLGTASSNRHVENAATSEVASGIDLFGNLRQIGLALHKYQNEHKHFPQTATLDSQQKPLLSWRVALLPYLGEEKLYKEFHLNEPWNSTHNRPLLLRMPEVYRRDSGLVMNGYTTFIGPLGKGTIFSKSAGTKFTEVADGLSNTIAVVNVRYDSAVPWTLPDRWTYDDKKPQNLLGELYSGPSGCLVVMCDGSVREIKPKVEGKTLMAAFTMNGGEAFDLERDLLEPVRATANAPFVAKRAHNPIADREAFIRRSLCQKTSVQFIETPLKDALKFLQEQHEIPVILDEPALTELGVNVDTQINLQIESITLNSVLNLILKPLKTVDFVVSDEVLKVTSRERAAKWRGDARPIRTSFMLVNEEKLRNALRAPTTVQFVDTPLKDALKFLQEQHGIPIVIDEPALTEAGIALDSPITLSLSDLSLRSLLNLMFERVRNVTYVIEDEVLQIVPVKVATTSSATTPEKSLKPKPATVAGARPADVSAAPGEVVPFRAAATFILRTPAEYRKAFDEADAAIRFATDSFNSRRSPVMARGADGGTIQLPPVAPLKTAELLTEELRKKYPEQHANLVRAINRRQVLVDEFKSQLQLLQLQVSRAEGAVPPTEAKHKFALGAFRAGVGTDIQLSEAKQAFDSAKLQLQEMKTLFDLYRKIEDDVLKPGSSPAPVIKKEDDKPVSATPAKPPIAKFDPDEITAKRLRNLRKIGEAMLRYYADNQRFPPAAKLNADDVSLLSWRVLLLPYLGEEKLFQEFHLNEPWNSAHNQALLARIPDVYATFGTPRESGLTKFLAPVGVNTVFADPKGMSLADIPDGAETTALVLDFPAVEDAVAWTSPQDKTFHGDGGFAFPDRTAPGVPALFCDGSVHYLAKATQANSGSLVAAITRNKHEWEDRGRRIGGLLGDVLPPQELPAQFPPDPLVVVDIVPQGAIYVERKKVTGDELLEHLRKRASKGRKPVVYLRGETSRGFEPIGTVQQMCQRAGFATSVHLFRQSRQLSGESGFQGSSSDGAAASFMPYPPVRDARAINLVRIYRALLRYSEHGRHQSTYSLRPSGQWRFQNAIRDPGDAQPLLSWRVALLPYLGEENLYRKFRLNEPWDGINNRKLISQMPEIFGYPGLLGPDDYRTGYVAVLTPNSFINDSIGEQKATGITAGFVHVGRDQAVTWTKPEDWKVDQQLPTLGLFSNRLTEIPAIFEDFSVRTISRRTVPDRVLGSTLTERDYLKQWDRDFGPNQLIPLGVTAEGKIELYLNSTWKEKRTITPVELYETVTAATWREIQPGVLLIYNSDSPQARMGLDIVRDCCRNLAVGWMEKRELFQEEKPKPKTSPPKNGAASPVKELQKVEGGKGVPQATDNLLQISFMPVAADGFLPSMQKQYRSGLGITAVEADGPASKAGILAGDVLVGLGDRAITSVNSLDFVLETVRITRAVLLKFIVVRGSETLTGSLKLPNPPADSTSPAAPTQSPEKSPTEKR